MSEYEYLYDESDGRYDAERHEAEQLAEEMADEYDDYINEFDYDDEPTDDDLDRLTNEYKDWI